MRVLSVDGGGYLGLASASFINEAERHFGKKFYNQFDLFCGTSTGAIIALALAAGLDGTALCELYERFGRDVFWNPFPGCRKLRMVRGAFLSMYGNHNLRKALDDTYKGKTLADLCNAKKYVMIPAFCLTNGSPRIFKTDHAPEFSCHNQYLLSDIALASAAAPFYLPLVKIKSPTTNQFETFCDGGVFANSPALLGYTEAIDAFKCAPSEVSVLSLSTPRENLAEYASSMGWMKRAFNARGALIWGSRLLSVFIDGNSMASHQSLLRVARAGNTRYERIEFQKPIGLDLDIATDVATTTLRNLGAAAIQENSMRERLKPFLN